MPHGKKKKNTGLLQGLAESNMTGEKASDQQSRSHVTGERWLISECGSESCLNIWKKKIRKAHTVHQNKFPMDLKVKYIKKKEKDRIIEENLSEIWLISGKPRIF